MPDTTSASSPPSPPGPPGPSSSGPSGPARRGPAAGLSRRRLLAASGGAGAAGLALGAGGTALVTGGNGDGGGGERGGAAGEPALSSVGAAAVPFHGPRQPGITTPLPAHGRLIAFDLAPGAGRRQAAALLRRWSELAARLMTGEPAPDDTGVALDAGPSSLTVTFGFGHDFFDAVGLSAARPRALRPLPDFSADALDPERSGGQLWVQLGSDDALVAFAAQRALRRAAGDTARVRWQLAGFNRTPGATARPMSMRNLMGQVDGTNNPRPADPDFDQRIFVPDAPGAGDGGAGGESGPAWMAGGSYAVVRRIRMLLDGWEAEPADAQERIIGRRTADGAPLTGGDETTPVDLEARGEDGSPVIAANAHVRVAAPESNDGAAMLRRSFSYDDGYRDDGAPDAGLLFVCWQADPHRAFVPVQRKLDRGDALSRFIRHESSALFAVPGGAEPGGYVGQSLLEG
jgi:dye decolorizing peroxidase